MPPDSICKTVHQYNKVPVSEDDMKKLQEIADDYRAVKNYVYAGYGGIGGLSKLYPGYTIQNEMTACGLREQLLMPSVYFYLAVFDALGDIKSQWSRTKGRILKLLNKNDGFTDKDKHYLRFILKVSNAWEAILNEKPVALKKELQAQYDLLAQDVNTEKLNRYLCRQVRRIHVKLHTDRAEGFAIGERAYRYGNHGIYISVKEKRKRIFIPLTDSNQYKRQLYVRLYPDERRIEIKVPVNVRVRVYPDREKQVGIAFGMYTMLTTDEGHKYGEDLSSYQLEYADWLRLGSRNHASGHRKYDAKKRRLEERLHSYMNHELNRFFRTEQPRMLYLQKMPKQQAAGRNKKINYAVNLWQRGYIRRRLLQKCREQAVETIEVMGKGISSECSQCGAVGEKKDRVFICPVCGCCLEEKTNTACNVKKRGQNGAVLHETGSFGRPDR